MRTMILIPLAFLLACNGDKADSGDTDATDTPAVECTTETSTWTPAGEDATSFTLAVTDDWSVARSRCVEGEGDASVYTAEPCVEPQGLVTEDVTSLFERSDAGELCLTPELCDLGAATATWEFYSVTASWQVCEDASAAE